MNAAIVWLFAFINAGFQVVHSSINSGPLYLTPLINKGECKKARNESLVQLFKDKVNATAHSGYITVNRTAGSNLFFLYFKAQEHPETAPLVLWLQGGPGHSSLFGQFLQNGPLAIDARGSTYKRNHTIQRHVNIIYLDAPVGAGYSFTKNESAYARNLHDVVIQVKAFLKQFLQLFPRLKRRDFYVAGESYGARFAAAVAHNLLKDRKMKVLLNLRGTIGGVGFLGPILDTADSSKFLYEASMVTAQGRDIFSQRFQQMKRLLKQGNVTEALQLLLGTILTFSPTQTLFQNLTLYDNHASALYTKRPPEMMQYFVYANKTDFRKAIHVGQSTEFQRANYVLLKSLSLDFFTDISRSIELLLNKTRVLFYTAQMDTVFPSSNLLAYFKTLNWTYASAYQTADRVPWKPYNDYYGNAGYIKQVQNFTEAVILGAGHYASVDKPIEAYYLMKQFIEGKRY
ncbi:hypothetical protein V5799_032006 [Amblyomma americanum]|uniref:Serine carboxypeptidase n=1 Tax=Amblyomma americanum TaxID=6943 RepID=A0AAQ4DSF8_AMBAM